MPFISDEGAGPLHYLFWSGLAIWQFPLEHLPHTPGLSLSTVMVNPAGCGSGRGLSALPHCSPVRVLPQQRNTATPPVCFEARDYGRYNPMTRERGLVA